MSQQAVDTNTNSAVFSASYAWDKVGSPRQIQRTDVGLGSETSSYTYDDLDRIVSVLSSTLNESYQYDMQGVGRLAQKGGLGLQYGLAGRPHLVTQATGPGGNVNTYSWDTHGNMTERNRATAPPQQIVWNWDDKPMSITTGATTLRYFYDSNGERVIKHDPGATGTTLYVTRAYEERQGGAETIHFVTTSGGRWVNQFRTDGSGTLIGDEHAHLDHLAGVAATTDAAGSPIENIRYRPYGDPLASAGPGIGTGAAPHRRYTGQEEDSEAGLYNYRARLYDPEIGSFLSGDPVISANLSGQNIYAYARMNPQKYVDPSGKATMIGGFIKGGGLHLWWLSWEGGTVTGDEGAGGGGESKGDAGGGAVQKVLDESSSKSEPQGILSFNPPLGMSGSVIQGLAESIFPGRDFVTSGYGKRGEGFHAGVDIRSNAGSAVSARVGGVVEFAGKVRGYGGAVVIADGFLYGYRVFTVQGHLQPSVSKGEHVRSGQTVGNTAPRGSAYFGVSTGPHEHLGVYLLPLGWSWQFKLPVHVDPLGINWKAIR